MNTAPPASDHSASDHSADDVPRVSVVMSAYNDEEYLDRSITGILNQTYTDFELIIVDDGSTDRTPELLQDFARQDPRIRILTQENQGLTRALIKGCAAARGEFICRHDADDYSLPERIEKQVEFLDAHPEVGFVACATRYEGPSGETIQVKSCDADVETATHSLRYEYCGPPAHGSVLLRVNEFRRVGGYREEFYFAQDSDLWLRLAELTSFGCLPEPLYTAALSPSGISGASTSLQHEFGRLGQECRIAREQGKSEEDYLRTAGDLTDGLRNGTIRRHSATNERSYNYLLGATLAQAGEKSGLKYLFRVLKCQPWHIKAWMRVIQLLLKPTSRQPQTN